MRSYGFAAWIVLALALPSAFARADGYPDVYGRTRDGWNIDFDQGPYIRLWKGDDLAHAQVFEDEPCAFQGIEVLAHPHKDANGAFVCAASGTSPLAGTVYEIRPVGHSECERGDPAERLTCVAGCGQGSRAPRVLERGYWEC
jgi:hypothetical protein